MKTTTFGGITREQHDAIPHTSQMIADETITDADIAPDATIAKSKLNLTGTITDADIAPDAAIAKAKIAMVADPDAHAFRHAVGGADVLPANSITDTMLNFGTWKFVSEASPSTNVDYVEFTGLDVNSDKMYVLLVNLKNPLGSSCWYNIFVEGDTTATNYYSQHLSVSGTSIAATRYNSPYIAGIGSGADAEASLVIFITKDADGRFRSMTLLNRHAPSGVDLGMSVQVKVAAISNLATIRIAAESAGGISTGSYFALFKVRTK